MTAKPKPQQRPQPRTTQQVLAQQTKQADAARQLEAFAKPAPTNGGSVEPVKPQVPAIPDARTPWEQYLDRLSPAMFSGQLIKFVDGKFIVVETDEEISSDRDFVALLDQSIGGWIKFNGKGEQPDRVMGCYYLDKFVPPPRSALGDQDQAAWPLGLSGEPEDPWKETMAIVLEDRAAEGAIFTFSTLTKSGLSSVGSLLRHFDRLASKHPDDYPIVRLKVGGFNSKYGSWVPKPVFAIVGRAPKLSAAPPDSSLATEMNDTIPF